MRSKCSIYVQYQDGSSHPAILHCGRHHLNKKKHFLFRKIPITLHKSKPSIMFEVKMLFGDKLGMCSIWHLHPLQCTTSLVSLIPSEVSITLMHGFLFSFLPYVLTSNLIALGLDLCNVSGIFLKINFFLLR